MEGASFVVLGFTVHPATQSETTKISVITAANLKRITPDIIRFVYIKVLLSICVLFYRLLLPENQNMKLSNGKLRMKN
jgi:hypothetical protein